ncbi:unnamed protein product [Blepharisma stoltei]|uniref:V-type proton ATPase subunit F n=1 Tax=Blepharisma stoltei TaxID=1481888 RepID=A0AAU9JHV7_9CILI|nr:unnamed protein product [Blepharisma stoltei]
MATRAKILKQSENKNLIAVIGDEDTVTGFLLTGIGERNHRGETNFFIVDDATPQSAIEEAFQRFLSRQDIAIILVTQKIADREIKHLISSHDDMLPAILEIPSKDCPYDPEKDSIMQRAARQLYGADRAETELKAPSAKKVA